MDAEELLRAGRLTEALEQLQNAVRAKPSDAKLRVFLFQLLSVMGQWERAMTQLNVAADLDAANLLMANVCRPALNAEALRAEIFAGKRSPVVFGEPPEWIGWMLEASRLVAEGRYDACLELRDRAFEACPATSGAVNDEPFEWIADHDQRLGPILEAIVEGKYYWVPFQNLREVLLEAPADLRDRVWMPATFTWANGGQSVGLIPSRYPGSEASDDSAIQLGRRTDWTEHEGDLLLGLGQRMLATDQKEYGLLEVHSIALETPEATGAEAPAGDAPDG